MPSRTAFLQQRRSRLSHRYLRAAMSTNTKRWKFIRCPVIEADTIDIPGWDKEIATPEF